MKTPITWKAIRGHLTYSWWKYALMAILAVFGWNLIYTVTEYHPPQDKSIKIYAFGIGNYETLDAYMENVRINEMSDMEEMSCVFNMLDETYTPMQVMTYVMAGEGHIYLLPKDYFLNYASEGAFLPLEDAPGFTAWLDEQAISYDRGWRADGETGEKHLYGVPVAQFPGLGQYLIGYEDYYITILSTNGNDANSQKFLQIFLEDMIDPDHKPPEVTAK